MGIMKLKCRKSIIMEEIRYVPVSYTHLDFSYEYVSNGDEEQILKSQNAFTWPVSLFKAQNLSLIHI